MTKTLALLTAAALLVPAFSVATDAQAPPPSRITVDDFSRGAAAWAAAPGTRTRTRTVDADPVLTLAGGGLTRPLPRGDTVSFDLRPSRGAVLDLTLGGAGSLRLREAAGHFVAGRSTVVRRTLAPDGWWRVEASTARKVAALDGRSVRLAPRRGAKQLVIHVERGSVQLRAYVATPASDATGLLLQRLAWLHTRTPQGKQPLGTGLDNRLRFSRSWTRGFWPGSLWNAYDLTRRPMFKRWARRATVENFGGEKMDTHDLGFMYGLSSAGAYDHLCRGGAADHACSAFRKSALAAASSLLRLAATNRAAGTIPTRAQSPCSRCSAVDESDTIIDSVMNLSLLFWASDISGDQRYRDLAARHARLVATKMVRPDGSTWSSLHVRRSDGVFLRYETHQGYRDDTTWARGQAWAIYGFAAAAKALADKDLLATAERTTRYVLARQPTPAVPLYDFDAPAGSPRDVSAGVIAAAGMLRLADACEALAVSCDPSPAEARSYARRLLTASLSAVGTRPPLGYLGHQVYGLGGASRWDDDAEMMFGLYYALEALRAPR